MDGPELTPDLFLARRAAAGHPEAWEQLVEAHGRRLYNLALQFSGSREDAEDLTQEIFLRLYRNLRSYRGEVPLIGWALSLSRNLCIDHFRRTRADRGWHRVAEAVLEQLPGRGDPEEESQRRQHLDAVYDALAELPEEGAEAVLLCDLQGWSLREASTYLGVPVGTVKSRLFRGRQGLTDRVRRRLGIPAAEPAPGGRGAGGATP